VYDKSPTLSGAENVTPPIRRAILSTGRSALVGDSRYVSS